MNYHILNIYDMLRYTDESIIQDILSSFSCSLNPEIEYYAHNRALDFTKKGISITYLVFFLNHNSLTLVGLYTIAYKTIQIPKMSISKTTQRKLSRFGEYNPITASYTLPVPLIAQLGKNYIDGLHTKISGNQLMTFAMEHISIIQSLAGGRIIYLECENQPKLLNFYHSLGFTEFSCRYPLENNKNFYYHQLMKFLPSHSPLDTPSRKA